MTGRRLCSEEEAMLRGFGGTDCARRRQVLRETVAAFEESDPPGRYHRLAKQNLDRWRSESHVLESSLHVQVFRGDWGEVTRSLTRTHGMNFAVLNMANAYVPGGAYVEGPSLKKRTCSAGPTAIFGSERTNMTASWTAIGRR